MIPFPPVEAGDPVRISASTFVTFQQCPDSANAKLQGMYGPDSRASFTGGLAHRLFSRHLREGPIAPEEFQQVCRSEIGSSTLNHKMAGLGLKPRELGQVIEEVGALYERFRRFPTEGFVGSEVAIEVEPSEGVSLLGTIDAVFDQDGTARLVDWKTGDLGEVVFQLGFYALIWSLDRGALPGRTEAVSVRTGERTESVPSRTEVVETARMVASMVDTLRRAWKTADPLARRGGPWCRFCPLLEGCEEGRAAATVASGGLRRGQS